MIINTLQTMPDTTTVAILIRHAERYETPTMSTITHPLLTEKGKRDAFILGTKLADRAPFHIYYSPVSRCKETAEQISLGLRSMNSDSPIQEPLNDIGAPYIKGDWQIIAAIVDKIGQDTFIRNWFNNEYSDELIMPLKEAAELQMRTILTILVKNHLSTINITHDWNIMTLREYYLNLKHEESGQVQFLDGLCTYIKGDDIYIFSNGSSTTIPLDTLR